MTNLPQVIARFIPPQLGGIVTVDENHKAVVRRGGSVVDMFSGGSRKVEADAEVVVASLQPFRMDIGFGNCPESESVHVQRPSLHTLDGEEIGCMTAAIQFALVRDDRANVQRLLSVPRQSNEITVSNLAADMDINIHTAIQDAIADAPRSSGRSLKSDYSWIRGIRQNLQPTVESEFGEYGLAVRGVHVNVVASNGRGNVPPPPSSRCTSSPHEAVKNGDIECVIALIAAGADINAKDNRLGNTPLHYAAWRDATEIMRALIAAGANIHAKNNRDNTSLHDAARNGKTNAAIALIAAGADIHAKGIFGNTPLHTAAWYGNTETAIALRDAGANLNAKNRAGYTPIDDARRNGKTETAIALGGGPPPPPPPPNGDFWVYEDAPASRARVHRGSCDYCNPGGQRNESENRWYGPFPSREMAFVAMMAKGKRDARGCGVCKP